MSRIGTIIRNTRKRLGLSQTQLAIKTGLNRSALGNYERGVRNPDLETLEIIADAFGLSLGELVNGEALRGTTPVFPANIKPITDLHPQRVPMLGSVAAGEPLYDEDLGVYVDSPVDCDAALTVKGDSMAPTYLDGDIVYIKCRPDVPEGCVAVVFVGEEATLKHVYKRPTGLTLISDNPEYAPIMVDFADYEDAIRIFGVPVGFTRLFKKDYKRVNR